MTADADDALDVVSEAVVIAYEKMNTVRDPDAFLGFILTVARNVYLRRRRRGAIFRPLVDADAEFFPALDPSPEQSADVRLLYDALAELPDRQREAVILFEIIGLPLDDIRTIQGGTLSGVKARVARGRRRLIALLNPKHELDALRAVKALSLARLPTGLTFRLPIRS
jgi:RNA polymerase sigma-70 factor (ECF subfamily)